MTTFSQHMILHGQNWRIKRPHLIISIKNTTILVFRIQIFFWEILNVLQEEEANLYVEFFVGSSH